MSNVISLMPKLSEKSKEKTLVKAIRIRMELEKFKNLVPVEYYDENVPYIEGRINYLAELNEMDGQKILDSIYARFAGKVTELTLVK